MFIAITFFTLYFVYISSETRLMLVKVFITGKSKKYVFLEKTSLRKQAEIHIKNTIKKHTKTIKGSIEDKSTNNVIESI